MKAVRGHIAAFFCFGATLLVAPWTTAQAQIISPGPLSQVHGNLEGLTNCTSCHKLGQKGASAAACLACHTPLASRIREGRGFHARLADQNCSQCHQEHLGASFDVLGLDTKTFDHSMTGYELVNSHRTVECRSCHKPDNIADVAVREFKSAHESLNRTYLGLSTQCATCHLGSTPHRNQFASQDCDSCHDESAWEGAPRFDHRAARFQLKGRHQEIQCMSCHPSYDAANEAARTYRGLDVAGCASCHTDPHRGTMGSSNTCTSCHNESGWRSLAQAGLQKGFDHSRTGFALVASHARASCGACHARPAPSTDAIRIRFRPGTERRTFPSPIVESCRSCHVDFHAGELAQSPGGNVCSSCHSESSWQPTTFDIGRHNRETQFRLTGAHIAAPCIDCHRKDPSDGRTRFRFEDLACLACHDQSNVHGSRFEEADGVTRCESCHDTEAWDVGPRFDHSITGFQLTGRHVSVSCSTCHGSSGDEGQRRLNGLDTACSSCHENVEPHESQFESYECSRCHDTVSFAISSFDHTAASFSLSGAHENVACASCHRIEVNRDGNQFVRFKPLSGECATCHQRKTK